jgi:glycerol-3-phosphate responsive antiterminator
MRTFQIKYVHTLHPKILMFKNKIKDLNYIHIIKFIHINLVTCAKY